jgi:hypothetical protein
VDGSGCEPRGGGASLRGSRSVTVAALIRRRTSYTKDRS